MVIKMTKKSADQKKKALLALLLVLAPALILILISSIGCEHRFQKLCDFGAVKTFTFVDADNKTRTLSEFKNDILLITTIQNECPNACAISLWHLNQLIYQHIRKNSHKKMKQVRIISFVTDGKGNPLKNLNEVKASIKDLAEGYDPKLWIIANGNARKIYDISNNGQTLLQKGDKYFGGEAFQELLLLIDKKGHLRMVLSGKEEGLIRRMKENIALLQKEYDKINVRK
jgi:cytochrome oxidase Cu insertion factor (SCO1/SenC/PrrC family)